MTTIAAAVETVMAIIIDRKNITTEELHKELPNMPLADLEEILETLHEMKCIKVVQVWTTCY